MKPGRADNCCAAVSWLPAAVLGLALGLLGGVANANANTGAAADRVDDLVNASEQALRNGATATAQAGFERAAALRHAGNIEMGLVRTAMQAGAYRQALAFGAHTAGDHLDEPAGSALYAWLLRMGGQDVLADRVLRATLARAPGDAVVRATRAAFDAGVLAAPSGVLLALPHRVAPQPQLLAGQAALLPGTRSIAAGVLLDGGRYALVPAMARPGADGVAGVEKVPRLWLRNGLGQTTEAVVDAAAQASFLPLGLTLLRLLAPLPLPLPLPESLTSGAPSQLAPRDPFAGSAGFALAYPASADAALAWPTLHAGFFGSAAARPGLRQLGFDVPSGPLGGPVFDAAGRVAGIAMGNAAGPGNTAHASMLPVSMWREAVTEAVAISAPAAPSAAALAVAGPAARMPTDEVYERGLKIAVQLLVGP